MVFLFCGKIIIGNLQIEGARMSEEQKGIWYAIGAYVLWGSLAVYWKWLKDIPSGEILAHRVFWSFLFVFVLLMLSKRLGQIKAILAIRKHVYLILISGFLISFNWFIYIWAVNHDHMIEASLGYYINPILSFALGVIVLREGMHRWQFFSILLATVGVLVLVFEFGAIPWIALSLALTFALYGLTKKLVQLDSLVTLGLETLMVFPLSLFYLGYLQTNGSSSLGQSSMQTFILLACSGVLTAIPLFWFAQGAKRLPYTTISFIQYISPTINLLLGIFLYNETFTWVHLVSFGFIWGALVLYSITSNAMYRQKRLNRNIY